MNYLQVKDEDVEARRAAIVNQQREGKVMNQKENGALVGVRGVCQASAERLKEEVCGDGRGHSESLESDDVPKTASW